MHFVFLDAKLFKVWEVLREGCSSGTLITIFDGGTITSHSSGNIVLGGGAGGGSWSALFAGIYGAKVCVSDLSPKKGEQC